MFGEPAARTSWSCTNPLRTGRDNQWTLKQVKRVRSQQWDHLGSRCPSSAWERDKEAEYE